MTLITMKMILFRGALSVIFGLALLLFADPLARLLMRAGNGLLADSTSAAEPGHG